MDKPLNYNKLYYFKVLAECENYTKAAKSLFISQPSLSHSIRTLELDLGVRLFEKDGRNVKLSKYGKILASYVDRGIRDIEEGNRTMRNFLRKNSGIVDLGFLPILSYRFIPHFLREFYAEPENAQIVINLWQYYSSISIMKILDGSLDLCLCPFIPDVKNVDFIPVFRQQLICIVGLRHPLAKKRRINLNDISQYPLIRYTDSAGEIQTLINNLLVDCRCVPEKFQYMSEEIAMAGLVATGHKNCIAIVPNLEVLEYYPICKIAINHEKAHRDIFLARRNKPFVSPCAELLQSCILKYAATVKKRHFM